MKISEIKNTFPGSVPDDARLPVAHRDDNYSVTAAELADIALRNEWLAATGIIVPATNDTAHGTHDTATGKYTCDGIALTADEVRRILAWRGLEQVRGTRAECAFYGYKERACLPLMVRRTGLVPTSTRAMFAYATFLEAVSIRNDTDAATRSLVTVNSMFEGCSSLRTVTGIVLHSTCTSTQFMFYGCRSLETLDLVGLPCNLDLADSPNLTEASLRRIIDNAANTSPITINIAGELFNALSGSVITAAAAKNISITF